MAAAQIIHAMLLSGGSAFGLVLPGVLVISIWKNAALGFDVGSTKVPLVCHPTCLI